MCSARDQSQLNLFFAERRNLTSRQKTISLCSVDLSTSRLGIFVGGGGGGGGFIFLFCVLKSPCGTVESELGINSPPKAQDMPESNPGLVNCSFTDTNEPPCHQEQLYSTEPPHLPELKNRTKTTPTRIITSYKNRHIALEQSHPT
jgi:hypothetical protein